MLALDMINIYQGRDNVVMCCDDECDQAFRLK